LGRPPAGHPGAKDAALIAGLQRAHAIAARIDADPLTSGAGASPLDAPKDALERRICRTAFLAPDLQLAILQGRHRRAHPRQDRPVQKAWNVDGRVRTLGYRSKGRTLEIDVDEAKTVRVIFARYLELGSVHRLVAELEMLGIMSRRRTTKAGQEFGGVPFTRGPLFHLLRNRTYLGEIPHKDTSYPGQHPGIIDRETFDQVQELLSKAAARRDSDAAPTEAATDQTRSLFVGRIRDEHSRPMTPTRAQKGGRHYRYYISRGPEHGDAASPHKRRRISASLLEETCLERLRRLGLLSPTADRGEIRNIIEEVEVGAGAVVLTVSAAVIELAGGEDLIRLQLVSGDRLVVTEASATLHLMLTTKRRGLKTVAFGPSGSNALQRPQLDHVLTSALLKAEAWKRKMLGGEVATLAELAAEEGLTPPYAVRVIGAAFLAPDLKAAILEGRQPPALTFKAIISRDVPISWSEQRALYSR
jgi:site-specific DNA recombinase